MFKIENPLGTPILRWVEKSNKFISNLVIEEHVVKQKLKDLNPLKSPGAGNIHPKVLKELSNSLAKPLTWSLTSQLKIVSYPKIRKWLI